jgi:hypothetical protein
VTFRPTLRRSSLLPSPKSLPLNSFADPHPLTPVPSILYKKHGGREGIFPRPSDLQIEAWQSRSGDTDSVGTYGRYDMFPIYPLSVHALTNCKFRKSFPLIFIRNTGGCTPLGLPIAFSQRCNVQPSNVPTFPRPIAAKRLWCHNPQWHKFSSRSGETTPLSPVSKTSERTSGTSQFCSPFASRAWVQRSKAGFRVCTCKP